MDDLADWRYEGVIYKASQDARNSKGDMHMCAPDGDQYIANMTDGAWAGFKYFAFSGDESKLSVKVRGTGSGTVKVFTDWGGKAVCRISVKPSETFHYFSGQISLSEGIRPLYFVYEGSGTIDFSEFNMQ